MNQSISEHFGSFRVIKWFLLAISIFSPSKTDIDSLAHLTEAKQRRSGSSPSPSPFPVLRRTNEFGHSNYEINHGLVESKEQCWPEESS